MNDPTALHFLLYVLNAASETLQKSADQHRTHGDEAHANDCEARAAQLLGLRDGVRRDWEALK